MRARDLFIPSKKLIVFIQQVTLNNEPQVFDIPGAIAVANEQASYYAEAALEGQYHPSSCKYLLDEPMSQRHQKNQA